MKNLVLILILFLLPVNTTLAVVANFYSHENETAVQHSSHHAHKHLSDGDSSGSPSPASNGNGVDKDCDFCHSSLKLGHATQGMAQIVLGAQLNRYSRSCLYSSYVPQRPERPNWHVFA
jgi:hypothetical protein